jgi:serine/threonine protein kinase
MRVHCESCSRSLDFSGDRPSFCAYCGTPLVLNGLSATRTYQPENTDIQDVLTQLPPTERRITFSGDGHTEPTQIGAYKVLRRLGSGGMGTVYEAEDSSNGRHVAVKVIKPHVAASPDNLERFRQEGRLASLITHPRCVFVYHADEEQGRPFIVMELMPGATLKDIVCQQGPLQLGQAISKILDVIEGLQAAHQIGVIHRDVKPSNCFMLTDGHVKVGDFGLSKFLPTAQSGDGRPTPTPQEDTTPQAPDAVLTRTGTFVGTPLFASPEQIKGDIVDFRSDIYSVSATLYFLLTGHAPFEGGDNTATIARIVSEDPVSIRALRPEIPTELDRVILRGLERQRDLRFSSLAELKQALLPFMPGYLQNSPRVARIRAAIVDVATLTPFLLLISQIISKLMPEERWGNELVDLATDFALWLVILGYYLVTEVWFGASFGKWLLRLRVGGTRPGKPPKRRQLLLRALGFFIIVALPGLLGYAITGSDWVKWVLHGLGLLLLFDSMRARGGFRGLHEVFSGTCVVQIPMSSRCQAFPILPPRSAAPLPPGMPTKIGNYVIEGIHRVLDNRIFLEGTDLILERPVWLVLRAFEEGKIASARRELSRSTRLRWLGGGDLALESRAKRLTHHWDAFIAPTNGCSLLTLIALQGRFSWADTRPILLQLSQELSISLTDGTFPDELGPEQIWLQPDGQLIVIGARFQTERQTATPDAATNAARSILFLRQVAALMLEGKIRDPKKAHPIEAPVPAHAHGILNRLFGLGESPFRFPVELVAALQETAEKPVEVTTSTRLGQLLLLAALLSPILLAVLIVGRFYHDIQPSLLISHQIRRSEQMIQWLGDSQNMPAFMNYLRQNPAELVQMRRQGLLDVIGSSEFRVLPRDTKESMLMLACQGQIKGRLKQDLRQQAALRNQLSFAAILPYSLALQFLPQGTDQPRDAVHAGKNENNRSLYQELHASLRHAQNLQSGHDEPLPLYLNRPAFQIASFIIASWFVLWVVWSMLTHGGISLRLMGFDLRTKRGSIAGPLRCAWRTFLLWLPFFSLLLLSIYVQEPNRWNEPWIQWGLWWLAIIYLAGCGLCALLWPKRGLHDRWSGIYLMPR